MSLTELFQKLIENGSGHQFTVLPVERFERSYIGISISGWPCFFSRSIDDRSSGQVMRTAHISLEIGGEYTVFLPKGTPITERFDTMLCESNDKADISTFLSLIDGFLSNISGDKIERNSLVSFFLSASRLLSVAKAKDLESERQGLWGELFFMDKTKGFNFWSRYWHKEPFRKFDFSNARKRLEVKTSVGEERIHHFSHRQVYSIEGEEIMIVSILLRKEEAGLSLRTLINSAKTQLIGKDGYDKIIRTIRETGMEEDSEIGPSFDSDEATTSIKWFWAKDAPHFRIPEPPGVSLTNYRIDLSTAPEVSKQEVDDWVNSWD